MTSYTTTPAGDRVAFDRYGAGPALIFVAGAGPSRESDPITTATALAAANQGITTVVYDRLGRGESPVDGPTTLSRELEAIAALIEIAGGRAVLCGHSSGCSIALRAAAEGLAITGLVLWESPIGSISGGAGAWSDEVTRRVESGDLDGAQTHYMKDMPPEWLEGARQSPMWPAIIAQVGSLRADGESLAWADSAPLSQLFEGIRMPVQTIVGERSLPLMTAAAAAIAAAIPGAENKTLPGANHAWEPESMAAGLVAFVKAAAEAGPARAS